MMRHLCAACVLLGCTVSEAPSSETALWEERAPTEELERGRRVWLSTCKRCHGSGRAGAPRLGDRDAWRPRLAQGETLLLEHALGGFAGPAGTEMPARGGNPKLSDAEVHGALRYMLSKSESGGDPLRGSPRNQK